MVAGVGFEPTTFGLCLPLQLSLLRHYDFGGFVVWTFPSPLPPSGVGVPAIKSLHLPSQTSEGTWLGITPPGASPTLTGEPARISPRVAHCKIRFQASR